MHLNISFKHMDASPTIREYTQEKTEKLKKFFRGKISVTWNFSAEKQGMVAHCHLVGNRMDYFGEAITEDLRASIDSAVDKIQKQIRRKKEIVKDHLHGQGNNLRANERQAQRAATAGKKTR